MLAGNFHVELPKTSQEEVTTADRLVAGAEGRLRGG